LSKSGSISEAIEHLRPLNNNGLETNNHSDHANSLLNLVAAFSVDFCSYFLLDLQKDKAMIQSVYINNCIGDSFLLRDSLGK
jgi:hypothetical protein